MKRIKKRFEDFKSFAVKGNVMDLAVGVVIGGAFGKIVSSLVGDVILPLIGLVSGRINLSSLELMLMAEDTLAKKAALVLKYGAFLQSITDFLIIAVFVYLFIKLIERFKRRQEIVKAAAPPTKTEELLTEIRDLLSQKKD